MYVRTRPTERDEDARPSERNGTRELESATDTRRQLALFLDDLISSTSVSSPPRAPETGPYASGQSVSVRVCVCVCVCIFFSIGSQACISPLLLLLLSPTPPRANQPIREREADEARAQSGSRLRPSPFFPRLPKMRGGSDLETVALPAVFDERGERQKKGGGRRGGGEGAGGRTALRCRRG